jgi:predicted ester cyclase
MTKVLILLVLVVLPAPLLAQAESNSGLEEKNKALMLRFYEEVWNKGNVAVVDEVFAETYLPHDTTVQERLQTEVRDEQKNIAVKARAMFAEFSFKPDYFVAEGDKVVGHWTLTGKPSGLLSIFSAKQVEFSGVNTFRFADGKVVEIWNNRDDLGMYQQLGFIKILLAAGFASGLALSALIWLIFRLKKRMKSRQRLRLAY